jgi:hypothetical protein
MRFKQWLQENATSTADIAGFARPMFSVPVRRTKVKKILTMKEQMDTINVLVKNIESNPSDHLTYLALADAAEEAGHPWATTVREFGEFMGNYKLYSNEYASKMFYRLYTQVPDSLNLLQIMEDVDPLNETTVEEILPQGSGINYTWRIYEDEKIITCANSFDFHDGESGMFTRTYSFSVVIPRDKPRQFTMDVEDNDEDLDDYLGMIIHHALNEYLNRKYSLNK